MAKELPLLPPVYSTTRYPGFSCPRFSAPSTIDRAIRSFILPVGFAPSSFTQTSAPPAVSLLSLTNGVLPIDDRTSSDGPVTGRTSYVGCIPSSRNSISLSAFWWWVQSMKVRRVDCERAGTAQSSTAETLNPRAADDRSRSSHACPQAQRA